MKPNELSEDLRESVRDFRNPNTTPEDRAGIRSFWRANGVRNQFGALTYAARLEAEDVVLDAAEAEEDSGWREGDKAIYRTVQTGYEYEVEIVATNFQAPRPFLVKPTDDRFRWTSWTTAATLRKI